MFKLLGKQFKYEKFAFSGIEGSHWNRLQRRPPRLMKRATPGSHLRLSLGSSISTRIRTRSSLNHRCPSQISRAWGRTECNQKIVLNSVCPVLQNTYFPFLRNWGILPCIFPSYHEGKFPSFLARILAGIKNCFNVPPEPPPGPK